MSKQSLINFIIKGDATLNKIDIESDMYKQVFDFILLNKYGIDDEQLIQNYFTCHLIQDTTHLML